MVTTDPASSPQRRPAPAPGPEPGVLARGRASLRRAAPALVVFASARAVGVAAVAVWAWHTGHGPRALLGLAWDAIWYHRIAEYGYGTFIPSARTPGMIYSDLAFFPLYPALTRAVHTVLPIGMVDSALLVAWTASGLAAWGIYTIGERHAGRRTGIALVLLWGLLPHSVVLTMAYTEPVMTACAAWALHAALTRRWIIAGALAALAGLARPNGVAVAGAVVTAVVTHTWQRARRRERPDTRAWAGAVLAPLGWLGYVAWVGGQTGRTFGYFDVQRHWGSQFDYGRGTLAFARHLILGSAPLLSYMAAAIVAAALLLLCLAVLLDRIPSPLLVYAGLLVVIAVGGANFFNCKPRFLLPAFPLLLPVATALAKARPRTAAVAVLTLAGLSWFYGTYLLTVAKSAI